MNIFELDRSCENKFKNVLTFILGMNSNYIVIDPKCIAKWNARALKTSTKKQIS
jgi:hypothetical protein